MIWCSELYKYLFLFVAFLCVIGNLELILQT